MRPLLACRIGGALRASLCRGADLSTLDEYSDRFDLEENFLDDKLSGFQIESNEVRNEQARTGWA